MNKIFIFMFLFFVFAYSFQVYPRDPFKSLLPKIEDIEAAPDDANEAEDRPYPVEHVEAPEITIQGILWGTDKPMAIINDNVYGVGDSLASVGATIHSIKRNSVFIMF